MITKQLNYKTLPSIAVLDGATTPALAASGTGTVAYSSTLGKPVTWNGVAWVLNYTHPATHPASVITQDASNRFVTDAEKTTWNAKQNALTLKTINGSSIVGTGDLIVDQSVFATDITINGATVGRGAGAVATNTAVGYQAGYTNTTGEQITAIGAMALGSNTTGANNTAVGQNALGKNTTGFNNTASGQAALYRNTTGASNTAAGVNALFSNTTGASNTASGQEAMYSNTTGYNNSALGQNALYSNTAGYNNTASGYAALQYNTTGDNNTASGYAALLNNSTGNNNTASGMNALHKNTTGSQNTASGTNALYSNTTGNNNSASSINALYQNTTGDNNTAHGTNALFYNTTGSGNVASGVNALFFNTTGSNNTALGAQSTSAGAYSPAFNCTTESNRVSIAHTGVTNAYIQVAWTVVSDARDKMNFAEVPLGLDFVAQLKPVAYQFKESRDSDVAAGPVRYGFKAQDIAALEPAPVVVDTSDEEKLRYNESSLIPILVKAIQELKLANSELMYRLSVLENPAK